MVDNHEAVSGEELGGDQGGQVKPKFNKEVYQNAAVREGWTRQRFKKVKLAHRSFNNTASVGASRWGPPLVDEDWHAMCPAICKGVEGAQWENLCYEFVEMNNEVNVHRATTHLENQRRQRKR